MHLIIGVVVRSEDLDQKITALEDHVSQLEALVAAIEQRATSLMPKKSE